MGVVRGARIVIKEDGRVRIRKLLGENDRAEQKGLVGRQKGEKKKEKRLSWGVSGNSLIWTPNNKQERRYIWNSVRCKSRSDMKKMIEQYEEGAEEDVLIVGRDRRIPLNVIEISKDDFRRGHFQEAETVYVDSRKRRFLLVRKPSKAPGQGKGKSAGSEGNIVQPEARIVSMPERCWKPKAINAYGRAHKRRK
jgi:hypothetical protein